MTRHHKLQADEKIQLANMLTISDPLRQAYRLKEEFYEILNSKDYSQMTKRWKSWHDHVAQANLPSFNRFMETTSKWSKQILQAAVTGYSNGFIDGCNN